MRTIIDLNDRQLEALKALCARKRISRAEAIRQAVDRTVRMVEDEEAKRARFEQVLNETFGAWKDRDIDGLEYQRQIRSWWDHRSLWRWEG